MPRPPINPGAHPAPRSVGRPRRLTLTQILDAAIAMGLDGLRIAALAKRLDVAPAVLYTYVSGRVELIRLAAQRASGVAAFPEDNGQSWRDYVTQYAEAHFRLVEDGQLISTLMHGKLSPASKLDSAEQWTQILCRHGFSVDEAFEMLRSVDVIVLGGAVQEAYARAIAGDEVAYRNLLRDALALRSHADLPILSGNSDKFVESATSAWRSALSSLIDSFERARSGDS